MPLRGDVKISNPVSFAMPTTTSSPGRAAYVSHHAYKTGSVMASTLSPSRPACHRATSLDRSSSVRDSTSFYRTYGIHSSYGRQPISYYTPSSFDGRESDILSRISSNAGLSLRNYNSRRSIGAVHDCTGSEMTDSSSSSSYERILESKRRNRVDSISDTLSTLKSRLEKSESDINANSSHLSSSSSSSSSTSYRTRFDTNSNYLTKHTADDEKTVPTVVQAPRHRYQPSSSSSSSPGGSSDDVSFSTHRTRQNTTIATTSGYNQDTSSSSYGNRRTSRDNTDKGGLVGLRNLGNTCFMNSVIQCLSNTKPLLEYCLKDSYLSECNTTISSMKGALIKAFASLLHSMWKGSTDSAINPQLFKNQIQKFAPRFMGYNQQDAQEFLRYLLQGLHEDVNRVTAKPKPILSDIDDSLSENQKAAEAWRRYLRMDDSKIVDIFVGQLRSCLQCTVCGHCSVTFDPFWDLSLPIPKTAGQVKLQQCFDLFTKEEVLDGDEKPTCSKCKMRRKCTKSLTIYKIPRILVIHLKRFSPTERYRAKLSTYVDFPVVNLDLSSYISKPQSCMFNLYAVSNHSGTIYSGHYTAYCKNPYTHDWHDYNDSRVSNLSPSNVVSSEAYVLFYETTNHSSRL